jgi:hypothetical protein
MLHIRKNVKVFTKANRFVFFKYLGLDMNKKYIYNAYSLSNIMKGYKTYVN